MKTEIVYLGHANSMRRVLKRGGVALTLEEMQAITRITLTLGTTLIDSDNGATDPILWAKAGYEAGEYRMFLGGQTITPGNYQGVLVVRDPTNPTGEIWSRVPIVVYADPEAAPPAP